MRGRAALVLRRGRCTRVGRDRLPDMVQELFTTGEEGAQNSMFAAVLEEMKQEIHLGASYTRFSCG
jgi:hypothetical protein